MSSEKLSNRVISFSDVIERAVAIAGVKNQSELAEYLGMSSGDMSNRKKRGSLPYDRLVGLALSRNVSLDWLIMGEGEIPDIPGVKGNEILMLMSEHRNRRRNSVNRSIEARPEGMGDPNSFGFASASERYTVPDSSETELLDAFRKLDRFNQQEALLRINKDVRIQAMEKQIETLNNMLEQKGDKA
jgi:hypothetical protein